MTVDAQSSLGQDVMEEIQHDFKRAYRDVSLCIFIWILFYS